MKIPSTCSLLSCSHIPPPSFSLCFSYSFRFLFPGTERCPQKGVVKQVASKLLRALSEKGLALLVNHGIPECKVRISIDILVLRNCWIKNSV